LAVLFSKQMTILFVMFVITLPFVFVGMKYLKHVKFIYSRCKSLWISFWWNAPLRTFTELFIEIALGFFLNSLNVGLS
jgi:hypothetical protein